ncbi:D-serine deaminase, pyridoxal phosphate-dependent [Desulfacinum hydrothermale DSM 13146]|uniref:D-serine deaminase, pyridoxal phosphate-dependent n=1 Tax=Desulfacinum hydrothermale DSM 13146 TaxID=1121390 RepID=A0A1W1X496_9BACT|nr:alanine racemase [Desulfacinum hydrothermale]SMC18712.1 D-serine deaminase, pyridoxal phosphate-dependent [Desulfacinum hydrothermale DSM 13146]
MVKLDRIQRPELILDEAKVRRNIEAMAQKAEKCGVRFRPHFKTHQSREIGRWFREVGVTAITVSSLTMARYFADDGWDDVTVAFPVNLREMAAIDDLASRIRLHLLAVHPETVEALERDLRHPVGLFIKVDCGYHRTGVLPEDTATWERFVEVLQGSRQVAFRGILTHAGHSYKARGADEIVAVHRQALKAMARAKEVLASLYPDLQVSVGDTPSCSVAEDFPGVDEIRPGAFVFYDLMQHRIGACAMEDVAMVAACPVVARHPQRRELVLYGGAVHLSKDGVEGPDGAPVYGWVSAWGEDGWELPTGCCRVIALSQEHGIVRVCPEHWDRFRVGDLAAVTPVHCCLTANLLGAYRTLDGRVITRL